jgi:hypothetical protein
MGQESVWFEVGVKEGHLSIAVAVFQLIRVVAAFFS